MNLNKKIDKETRLSVITAFNRFIRESETCDEKCEISLPALSGRLHKTFILTVKDREKEKYVVQKLRMFPFNLKAVEFMLQLIEIAQNQAEALGAFDKNGVLEGWCKVKFLDVAGKKTVKIAGKKVGRKILFEYDKKGNPFSAWRVMEYVEGAIYNGIADIGEDFEKDIKRKHQLVTAELLGEAIAHFSILMSFTPKKVKYQNTLLGFHNTKAYVHELESLLRGEKVQVLPGNTSFPTRMIKGLINGAYRNGIYTLRVKRMIEIFRKTSLLAGIFENLPKILSKGVAHGDLKFNNVIWATDSLGLPEHVLCFIDLDSIGVYTALDDFGDAARSIINVLGEEIWKTGNSLEDILLDREILERLIQGYSKGFEKKYKKFNIENLKIYLYRAVALYFFQLGTRFFKSFISEYDNSNSNDKKQHFVYFVKQSDDDIEDKNLRLAEVQYTALIRFLKEYKIKLRLDELKIDPNQIDEPVGWKKAEQENIVKTDIVYKNIIVNR